MSASWPALLCSVFLAGRRILVDYPRVLSNTRYYYYYQRNPKYRIEIARSLGMQGLHHAECLRNRNSSAWGFETGTPHLQGRDCCLEGLG